MWNFVNLIDSVITVPAEAPKAVVSRFVAFSMDLNKASQKQIMEVQLIGEVLSERIVKHRPFSSWAEVKTLVQIGDKRLCGATAAVRHGLLQVAVQGPEQQNHHYRSHRHRLLQDAVRHLSHTITFSSV